MIFFFLQLSPLSIRPWTSLKRGVLLCDTRRERTHNNVVIYGHVRLLFYIIIISTNKRGKIVLNSDRHTAVPARCTGKIAIDVRSVGTPHSNNENVCRVEIETNWRIRSFSRTREYIRNSWFFRRIFFYQNNRVRRYRT